MSDNPTKHPDHTDEPNEQPVEDQQSHPHHSSSLPTGHTLKSPGIFASYTPYPKGVEFINQEPEEEMLLFLRRHFITNVPWIFFTVLFLLLPPFVSWLFQLFDSIPLQIPQHLVFIILAFYYLFIASYALGKFIVWFYHVGIVTQTRVLDLDVDNVLHYDLAEAKIGEIVDVSYSQKGFFESFFNYGDVFIQTEALKAHFMYEQSPQPARVADIITDLEHHLKGKGHHDKS